MADSTNTLQIVISAKDEASAAIGNVGGSLNVLKQVLLALGLANLTQDMINLGKAAFNTGLQFQTAMENIQGNTGMTNAQIAQMQKEVLGLAEQSGIAGTDIANAFMYAYDITQNMNDSLKVTTAAMEAVRIAGGSMTDATKILAITMHDWNIPASEAGKTMDEIVKIVQGSASNFSDLNSQFTVMAGTASALGIPLDQTGALFDALTRKLGDSNRAAVEANMFLLAVADAHKSVQAAIGNTTSAVTGSTKAHKDYSDSIKTATDRIQSEEDRLKSMKDTTVKQKDAYQLLTDTIKSHQDSLVSLEAKQNNVATSAMSKVDPALRGLAGDFSDAGLKAKGVVGILNDIQAAAGGNSQELQKLFPNYRSLYAAMSLTSDKGADVKQSLANIDTAKASDLTAAYTERLKKLDSEIGISAELIKGKWIKSFQDLSPAMTTAMGEVNKQMEGKGLHGKGGDGGLIGQLLGDTAKGGEAIGKWFKSLEPEFIKGFDSVLKSIDTWAKGVSDNIKRGFDTASKTVQDWINSTVRYFQALPGKVESYIYDLFTYYIPYAIGDLAGKLSVIVPKMINDIGKWFSALPGAIEKTVQDTYKKVIEWMTKTHDDSVAKSKKSEEDIKAALEPLPGHLEKIFTDAYNTTVNWITKTWAWVANEVSQWPARIQKFIDAIPGEFDAILKAVNKTVDDDLNAVWKTATNWWNSIVGIFNNIINTAKAAVSAVSMGFAAGQGSVPKRAGGGFASGLTLVGEQGPELVSLPQGSYVHNNTQTNQMLSSGGVNITFSGPVNMDSASRVNDLARQIIRVIGRQNELAQKGYSVF